MAARPERARPERALTERALTERALTVAALAELACALAGVLPGSAELAGPVERPARARPDRPGGADPAGVREIRRALVIRGAAHLAATLLRHRRPVRRMRRVRRRRPGGEGQGGPARLA